MRYKWRVLELLKDASDDIKSMTVGDLVDKLTEEIELEDKKVEENNNSIINKFPNTYIKQVIPDGIYGIEVEYIYIEELVIGSMNTEYEQLYNVIGEKITCSHVINSIKELDGRCQTSMGKDELYNSEIITKEDYDNAKNRIETIQNLINQELM